MWQNRKHESLTDMLEEVTVATGFTYNWVLSFYLSCLQLNRCDKITKIIAVRARKLSEASNSVFSFYGMNFFIYSKNLQSGFDEISGKILVCNFQMLCMSDNYIIWLVTLLWEIQVARNRFCYGGESSASRHGQGSWDLERTWKHEWDFRP